MEKKVERIKNAFIGVIGILICVGSLRMLGGPDESGRSDAVGMSLVGLGILVYIAMRVYLKTTKVPYGGEVAERTLPRVMVFCAKQLKVVSIILCLFSLPLLVLSQNWRACGLLAGISIMMFFVNQNILKLKESWRKIGIWYCLLIFVLLPFGTAYIVSKFRNIAIDSDAVIAYAIILLPLIIICIEHVVLFYYLTRPNVKEQFK